MENLLNKRLVVFTGKGGIGKTLCSAAFGQYAANKGLRTLLVERSEKDQIGPLFGMDSTQHREVSINPNLTCINLSASICLEEYVVKQLGQKKLFEKVFNNNLVRTFFNTIPGLAEAMILGRIFHSCELIEPRKYDLVIFDAPASGHMLNLMTTPDAIINSGVGGPIVKEITRVKDFLADKEKCAGVLVTVPETLISSETLEFLPKLQQEAPLKFSHILVNKAALDLTSEQKEKLLIRQQSGSGLQAAVQFALDRNQKALEIQHEFLQAIRSHGHNSDLLVYHLPHVGVIPEPLENQFADQLFAKVGNY